jgi:threonine dehydratase
VTYPALNELLDAEIYVKREDCQPTSAFKVRGGINLLAHLPPEERRRGLVTASTGNHGQSIAYASRLFSVRCTVVAPQGANPLKVQAMERLGATVLFHGRVFDDAREHAERLAAEQGMRFVHPANEHLLIAGVATEALEVLEEAPDLDLLFVPVGGGSTAAGACIVAQAVNPRLQVIAVQSAQAPAAYRSWKAGRILDAPMETMAEGLATRTGYELTQSILRDSLADFVLVDDAEIKSAIRVYLEKCHALSEPAGAAALAGAIKSRDQLRAKKVGVILSGANITLPQLGEVLAETAEPPTS